MGYEIIAESTSPSSSSLCSIGKAMGEIQPDSASLNDWYATYAQMQRKRLAHDVDYVQMYVQHGSKIIELGSIPLILTRALSELGYDVYGIDIAPERFQTVIESSRMNVTKVNIETEPLPFHTDEFDAALFNELFEHLRINPVITLHEVHRVMKPGGTLLLSTPNLTSLDGWVSLIFRNKAPGDIFREYTRLETLGHVGHVRIYTPVEVCSFLEQIGFQVQRVIYRGTVQPNAFLKKCVTGVLLGAFPRLRPHFSIVAVKPAAP